jgi:hypothetical protein
MGFYYHIKNKPIQGYYKMVRILKITYVKYIFENEERLLNDDFFDPISKTLLFHKQFNHKNFVPPKVYGITGKELCYVGSNWQSYVKKLKMVQLKLLSKQYEKQGALPISEYNDMINNE